MLRRYFAYRPGEVVRIYRLVEHAAHGSPGHGPAHLFFFVGSPDMVGWVREGLPVLSNLAGPIQHFWSAVLEGWSSEGCSWGSLVGCRWYLAAP